MELEMAGNVLELKALDAHKEKIKVRQDIYNVNEGPVFSPSEMYIIWKPTIGLQTNGDGNLTPTAILDHELDHALTYVTNLDKYKNLTSTPNNSYSNMEEKRVITGSEQSTARKLGLIKKNQVTRRNHSGSLYETAGVNTTIPNISNIIEEVIIIVRKKEHKNEN